MRSEKKTDEKEGEEKATTKPMADETETTSIQEFIERKKLQNRILLKMIEKINQSDEDKNTKTKK
jgi:hypothetical protein